MTAASLVYIVRPSLTNKITETKPSWYSGFRQESYGALVSCTSLYPGPES